MLIGNIQDLHFQEGRLLPVLAAAWFDFFDVCRERRVEVVKINGDIFDDCNFGLGRDHTGGDIQAAVLLPLMMPWRIEGIKVVVVPGNHDLRPGHKSACDWMRAIPNVEVYDEPTLLTHVGRGGEVVLDYVMPWSWNSVLASDPTLRGLSRAEFKAAAEDRRREQLRVATTAFGDARAFKILSGHAVILGSKRPPYVDLPPDCSPVYSVADLVATGADAQCWGHIHGREIIDGVQVYGGALAQLHFGHEGEPAGGEILDTSNGQREFVEIRSPRHFTVNAEDFRTLQYLPGYDRVKVRGLEKPRELSEGTPPDGVVFEKVPTAAETRQRAEGITVESTVEELFTAWHPLRERSVPAEAVIPHLHSLLEKVQLQPLASRDVGCIDAIREIRMQNIVPFQDMQLRIPEAQDGLLALVGENGSGKTKTLGAVMAVLDGEFPYYPGPLYDHMPEGFVGDGLIEVVLVSKGQTYRASRKLHVTKKTRTQETFLYRIPADGPDEQLAGPKQDEFKAACRRIFGDPKFFMATVFQSQDDVGSFIEMEPAERLEFARKWVDADRFDPLREAAKEQATKLRGSIETLERRRSDLAAYGEEVGAVEGRIAEAQAQEKDGRAAVGMLGVEKETIAETTARLRADQLAREEIARQVEAAGVAAHQLANNVQVAMGGIDADELELKREPKLITDLERLRALREELARAQRQEEIAAAALANRREMEARIKALDAEIDTAWAQAKAAAEARRADLRSQYQEIGAQIAAAETEARADVESRRVALRMRIQELDGQIAAAVREKQQADQQQRMAIGHRIEKAKSEIDSTRKMLEADVLAWRREVSELEAKAARLEQAGCKAAPMPCRFIDDAREAPARLESLRASLAEREADLTDGSYAEDARADIISARDEWVALPGVVPEFVATDLRTQRATAQTDLEAIADFDLAAVATDLRTQRATLAEQGRAIKDPAREQVAPAKALQVDELTLELGATPAPKATGRPLHNIHNDITTIGNPEQALGRLDAIREQLVGKREALRMLEADLQTARDKHTTERARLEAVASVDTAMAEAAGRATDIDRRIEEARANLTAVAKRIGALEGELKAAQGRVEEARGLGDTIEAFRRNAAAYALLVEFFGPYGGSQLLVDIACSHVNEILSTFVSAMGEAVVIELTTQRDLKGGGTEEGLYVYVTDYAGRRDMKQHSYGEKSWMVKILRMALGEFGAQRHGAHHAVTCMDEPTNGLDSGKVPRFMGVVYRAAHTMRQVWIVSHDPQLLSGISSQVLFTGPKGATRIESTFAQALPESVAA